MNKRKQCERCGKEVGILYFLPGKNKGVCEKCLESNEILDLEGEG